MQNIQINKNNNYIYLQDISNLGLHSATNIESQVLNVVKELDNNNKLVVDFSNIKNPDNYRLFYTLLWGATSVKGATIVSLEEEDLFLITTLNR